MFSRNRLSDSSSSTRFLTKVIAFLCISDISPKNKAFFLMRFSLFHKFESFSAFNYIAASFWLSEALLSSSISLWIFETCCYKWVNLLPNMPWWTRFVLLKRRFQRKSQGSQPCPENRFKSLQTASCKALQLTSLAFHCSVPPVLHTLAEPQLPKTFKQEISLQQESSASLCYWLNFPLSLS